MAGGQQRDQIAAPAPEDKDVAGIWILFEHCLRYRA
jgi:hypothetical protein